MNTLSKLTRVNVWLTKNWKYVAGVVAALLLLGLTACDPGLWMR